MTREIKATHTLWGKYWEGTWYKVCLNAQNRSVIASLKRWHLDVVIKH